MKRLRNFLISTGLMLLPLTGFAQQTFTTPELAAQALVKAIEAHDDASMQKLLGNNW